MIEQLKPLTDVLNERAKNPIIGGFVFSWLVVNFKHWSLLVVGPIDGYPTRLSSFLTTYNACEFILIPMAYAIGIYFCIYLLSFVVSSLNIRHLKYVADRSEGLAESQNRILKLQNESKEYLAMQSELDEMKESSKKSELIINATNDLRDKLDVEMKDNSKVVRDKVRQRARVFRKEILESCNNNPDINIQLDNFIEFVDSSVVETYEYVVTPIRKHTSIVERLIRGDLT